MDFSFIFFPPSQLLVMPRKFSVSFVIFIFYWFLSFWWQLIIFMKILYYLPNKVYSLEKDKDMEESRHPLNSSVYNFLSVVSSFSFSIKLRISITMIVYACNQ